MLRAFECQEAFFGNLTHDFGVLVLDPDDAQAEHQEHVVNFEHFRVLIDDYGEIFDRKFFVAEIDNDARQKLGQQLSFESESLRVMWQGMKPSPAIRPNCWRPDNARTNLARGHHAIERSHQPARGEDPDRSAGAMSWRANDDRGRR